MSSLYYECHVTTEVIPKDRRELFDSLCKRHGFWASNWKLADVELKFFATSRGANYDELKRRMLRLIADLKAEGFSIWRYKIEDTILDSKVIDSAQLVDARDSVVLEHFDRIGG